MEDEKTSTKFWTAKCYCEDAIREIKVPFGVSSNEIVDDFQWSSNIATASDLDPNYTPH